MVPVVCIVGKHNAGKTTLLERLIPCLQARGRKVAVIKHAAHGMAWDREGSDSWRLARTEAAAVMVSGPESAVTFSRVSEQTSLPQLLGLLPVLGFDLVLVEGFKRSDYPKVEVHRSELGPDLLVAEEALKAVVTDGDPACSVPQFHPNDPHSLAAFIDENYPRPNAKRDEIRIAIDGEDVPVNAFASAVISGGILGMLSALKGVGSPDNVRIEIRKQKPEQGA